MGATSTYTLDLNAGPMRAALAGISGVFSGFINAIGKMGSLDGPSMSKTLPCKTYAGAAIPTLGTRLRLCQSTPGVPQLQPPGQARTACHPPLTATRCTALRQRQRLRSRM